MPLSYDLVSQFAKLINKDKKTSKESTVYGMVIEDDEGNKYVKIDGSDRLTPLSNNERPSMDLATVTALPRDRVTVTIKDHTATVTGNMSSPAARNNDVAELGGKVSKIQEFDIAIGERITAQEGYIKTLQADTVRIGNLSTANADIIKLIVDEATIKDLISNKITVVDLIASKVDTSVLEAKYATIGQLNLVKGEVLDLTAANLDVTNKLTANEARINAVDAKIVDAETGDFKFVTTDFANIGEAAVENFYAVSGIITNLILDTGEVVKELVGVRITGDSIVGETIRAENLIVKGEDGLFYKLNVNALGETTASSDEKYQNGLDGSVIVAKSITAEKVSVSDLVAFGAKIADFTIEGADPDADAPGKLYSYVKDSDKNPTRGVYLDTDGQVAFGDHDNYLKFLKNEDESYTLEVRASRFIFGAGQDIQNEIDAVSGIAGEAGEAAETAKSIAEDAVTQILHLNDVVEEVKGSYARIVSNEDGTTSIVQSGTGYKFNFHDVTDLQNDMLEAKEHRSYISFEKDSDGNASMSLHGVQTDADGNAAPGYKLKLTGNDMQFVSDQGKTVARIIADDDETDDAKDSLLEIEKAKINTELRQGNFVWQARNGGNNFGLIWKPEKKKTNLD